MAKTRGEVRQGDKSDQRRRNAKSSLRSSAAATCREGLPNSLQNDGGRLPAWGRLHVSVSGNIYPARRKTRFGGSPWESHFWRPVLDSRHISRWLPSLYPGSTPDPRRPAPGTEWIHERPSVGTGQSLIRGTVTTGPRVTMAALLDGEVIVQDARGAPDFEALRSALSRQERHWFSRPQRAAARAPAQAQETDRTRRRACCIQRGVRGRRCRILQSLRQAPA